jgi:hypothetical protein
MSRDVLVRSLTVVLACDPPGVPAEALALGGALEPECDAAVA